jgi:PAS domain S-box-containing protein
LSRKENFQSNRGLLEHIWEGLNKLVLSIGETDIESSLDQVLHAAKILTGANTLAIYQADDQSPTLHLINYLGDDESLPKVLPGQDLIKLRRFYPWSSATQSSSTLHEVAKESNLVYLVSSPLGTPNALIGLFLIADKSGTPPENINQILDLLCETTSKIFEQQSRNSHMRAELSTLKQQQRVNFTLEERINEGLLLLNPELKILRMNLTAEMILGYANNEVCDQPVDSVLIGTETLLPSLSAAQRGSTSYDLGNLRLFRRNGEAFVALVRLFPILEDSQVEGIIVLLQDLSEQEEIRIQTQQLEQRAVLGEITAIFAHEVRNPINNISTGLQLMDLNLPEDDPNRELITRLQQDCDRLTTLMKSVLSFSRTTDYEKELIDLPTLLKRLIDRLHPRITRVNVEYNLQIESDCAPILGDMRALEQVFNNLINNALQAMHATGGRLAIKVKPIKSPEGLDYIQASIADTGPGIPKELQEKVFQPFYTSEQDGTGLGLAISKRIVSSHNGVILLNSVPGGTVFQVQFPVANPEKP